MITTDEARSAMLDVQTVRNTLVDRCSCPPAFRLTMATLMGGVCAAQTASGFLSFALEAGIVIAVVAMALIGRRRAGFFVNGYRSGRTRRVAVGLLVAFESIYAGCFWLKEVHHVAWAPLAGGVVIIPIAYFATSLWQAAYRSEFEKPAGSGR